MMFDNREIKVSVICNAYNHEKYIRAALDGFVMQKTNFAFEVLVHDDASTDNTANIIREYETKYPELIKPIYQTENQYSKGIKVSTTYQYPRAKGKYIALCEGDDYWIDPYKLQKQVEALEKHPEVDICAHSAYIYSKGKKVSKIAPSKTNCIFTTEQVIAGGGAFVATNSLIYRKEILNNVPKFRQLMSYDYTAQIHGSLRGGMLYLKNYMAVYNYGVESSWTVKTNSSNEKFCNHIDKTQQMLKILNEETEYKYEKTILKRSLECEFLRFYKIKEYRKIFKNREIFNAISFKQKIKLLLKICFPFLHI